MKEYENSLFFFFHKVFFKKNFIKCVLKIFKQKKIMFKKINFISYVIIILIIFIFIINCIVESILYVYADSYNKDLKSYLHVQHPYFQQNNHLFLLFFMHFMKCSLIISHTIDGDWALKMTYTAMNTLISSPDYVNLITKSSPEEIVNQVIPYVIKLSINYTQHSNPEYAYQLNNWLENFFDPFNKKGQ